MKGVKNYLKNVTKSFTYMAADTAVGMMPNVKEFTEANQESFKSSYAFIRNPKSQVKKTIDSVKNSKVYEAVQYGAKNAFEDLKTGNWYNKAREDEDATKFMGSSMSMDNWNDLSEFGIDADWESKLDKEIANEEVTAGDLKIIDSVEKSNAALAGTTANAIVTSAEYQAKTSKINTSILFSQNERLLGGLHKDLNTLNTTMANLYGMHDGLFKNMDKNMSDFFTRKVKADSERNAMLKEMLEMQRNTYMSAQQREQAELNARSKTANNRWADINVAGLPRIEEYFNSIKGNINNLIESQTGMMNMFGEDSNILASFMSSPLKYAVEAVTKSLVPATIKMASEELDKSISGVFGNFIARMTNARNSDGPLSILGKIFGVNANTDKEVDTSKYYKGAIPFDGLTRKAIMDVIPTYLRRIEAHLSGSEELVFDYNSGKWKKAHSLKKELDSIKKRRVQSATSSIRYDMRKTIKTTKSGIVDKESFEKALDEFWEYLYDRNGDFNPNLSIYDNNVDPSKYQNFSDYYNTIVTMYKNFDVDAKTGRNRKLSSRYLGGKILSEKDREKEEYKRISADTGNILTNLFNGIDFNRHGSFSDDNNSVFKAKDKLLIVRDSYGNNIYDYLQKISSELQWQRDIGFEYLSSGLSSSNIAPTVQVQKDKTKKKELDKTLSSVRNSEIPKTNFKEEFRRVENIKNEVANKVSKGEAIYLSDFGDDDQETLEQLAILLRKDATTDYERKLKSIINNSDLSRYLNKKFYGSDDRFKNLNRIIANEDLDKKQEEEDKKKKRSLLDKFGFVTKARDVIGNIASAPVEVFTDLLESADRAIYQMMFKSELKDEKDGETSDGFMGWLTKSMSKVTDKIGSKIDDILDPIKEKLGIGKDFKDDTTKALKSIGRNAFNMFVDANAQVYQKPLSFIKQQLGLEEPKAKRSNVKEKTKNYITSSNIASLLHSRDPKEIEQYVSGELGYETVDKKKEALIKEFGYKEEQLQGRTQNDLNIMLLRSKRKFSNYAHGTLRNASPYMGRTMLSKGEMLFNKDGVSVVNETNAYDVNKPTHILSSYQSYPILKKMGLASGNRRTPTEDLREENRVKSRILNKAFGTIDNHATGNDDKEINKQVEIAAKQISRNDILEAIKQNAPEGVAGGVVGGIVSTLLGIVGGPLLGMTIGAAGNIVANSEGLKNALFGIKDQNGKREGGIVSKKIIDSVHKYAPNITKYGLAGIIPGLVTPLGPLGGLLAGGVIGFLKSNDEFSEKYFGPNGKLAINDTTKNAIKKMLPNAGIGAGAGAVISVLFGGPFGLLGNAALGGAIGMMTSTEEFKNGILGTTVNGVRQGGVLGGLRQAFGPLQGIGEEIRDKFTGFMDENVFDPLRRFINPVLKDLPHIAGMLPRMINRAVENTIGYSITDIINKSIAAPFAKHLRKVLEGKGLVGRAVSGVGRVVTSPFRALGSIGDKVQSRRITEGRETQMTAQERIDWLEHNGRGSKVSEMDKYLAGIGDVGSETYEQARKTSKVINEAFDDTYSVEAERSKVGKQLLKRVSGFTTQDGGSFTHRAEKQIKDAIKSNLIDRAYDIMRTTMLTNNRQLTESEFKALTTGKDEFGNSFESLYKTYQDLTERKKRAGNLDKKAKDAKFKEFSKEFENLYGRKPKNIDELRNYANLIDTELRNREASKKETDPLKEANEKIRDATATTADNTTKMLEYMRVFAERIQSDARGTSDWNRGYKDAVEKNVKNATTHAKDRYDQRKEEIKDTVGEENYEDLSNETIDRATGKQSRAGDVFRKGENKGKETDLLAYVAKGILTTKQANLIKNGKNVKAIARLLVNKKYKLSNAAITYMNECSAENANAIANIFDGEQLLKLYEGSEISKEDCIYAIKHFKVKNSRKKFYKFCADLLEAGAEPGSFDSLEKIDKTSPSDLAQENDTEVTHNGILYKTKNLKDTLVRKAKSLKDQMSEPTEEIDNHGLGTMLLGGIGKAAGFVGRTAMKAGKGVLNLGKKAVGGIASLFKGKKDGDESAGAMGQISDILAASNNGANIGGSAAGGSDIDKPGDNKIVQYVPEVNSYMYTKKTSDGDIVPDTSQSTTKETLRKIADKDKKQTAFQKVQQKAMETINRAFNTDDEKDSKKGKLSWWKLLLAGIVGLPFLKPLFEKIISPLWTNIIQPGLKTLWDDVAKPTLSWAWEGIKSWIGDTAFPWLTGTGNYAGKGLPTILGESVVWALESLPRILLGMVGGAKTAIAKAVLPDSATNAPNQTTVKAEGNTKTSIVVKDKKGNVIAENVTGDELSQYTADKNQEYAYYNGEGEVGTVNSDGTVTFDNTNDTTKTYFNDSAKRGIVTSAVKETIGPAGKVLDKVGSRLLRNADETTKLGKASKFLGKFVPKPIKTVYQAGKRITGVALKTATVPGKIAADTMNMVEGFAKTKGGFLTKAKGALNNGKYTSELVESAKNTATKWTDNIKGMFKGGTKKAAEETVKQTAEAAAEEAAEKATKEAAEKATKEAVEGNAGIVQKVITKAKSAITKVLENAKVQKYIAKAANAIGKNGEDVLKTIQKNFNIIVKEAAEEGSEKLAKEATKSTFKTALKAVLSVGMVAWDFIYGWDNSEAMLGVEETTMLESLVCGIVNAALNLVPFLTIVLPADKVLQKLIKIFEKDEEFLQRQQEADAKTEEENEKTGKTQSTKERLSEHNLTYKISKGVSGFFSKIGNGIKGGIKWVGDKLTGKGKTGQGKETEFTRTLYTTGNKKGKTVKDSKFGRAKQIDPAIANIRYNAPGDSQYQTIGDSGCGPAAAVTAVQSIYGRGNEVVDAAKFAVSSGYKEKDGGTKPGFFKEYFNRNGLDSSITYNKSEIERNLRSGNTTVLMGKDTNGVSQRTPYGTNPHYVTVTDMRGDKVIIQDPESKYDNQVYDVKDVLNKSSIGISAYGKAKQRMKKYGRSKYGMGLRGASVNEQIYNFFIDNGFTGQAAAGILGNMVQEAGVDANGQIKLHSTESTGEGIGIIQWSHGRKTAFQQYCNSIGQPWPNVTLDSQLQYIMYELQNGQWMFASGYGYPTQYKISFEEFKKSTAVDLATGAFCANYERCKWKDAHMDDVRIPSAIKFYEQFSGNKAQLSNGVNVGSVEASTTNTSSNNGGIIGNLINLFTDTLKNSNVSQALSKLGGISSSYYEALFGKKEEENSSDANTTTNTSSGGVGGEFPKYTGITDSIKNEIAGVIVGETGGDDLVAAKQEASQMANLNEVSRGRGATGADISKTLHSGWYANSSFGKTPTENALKAVEDVLINGKRTLPRYVTEHDMFPLDAAMDGTWGDKNQDRSKYIQHQTTIKQNPSRFGGQGASYQFYDFFGQNKDGDVAGYYAQDYEKYKSDTAWGAGGNKNKMVSKYGDANKLFGEGSRFGMGSGHKVIRRKTDDSIQHEDAPIITTTAPSAPSEYGKATSVDYTSLIQVIIETLITIADNSDKLNTIVTLLQNNLGASITSNDVNTKNKNTGIKQKLQNALSSAMRNKESGPDDSILSIINAMNAIASE